MAWYSLLCNRLSEGTLRSKVYLYWMTAGVQRQPAWLHSSPQRPRGKPGKRSSRSLDCLYYRSRHSKSDCTASRPSEGTLRFNMEFSPMASPAFDAGRPGEAAIEAMRLLERALRDSRAVDLEALCVLAGRKVPCRHVWHLLHAQRAGVPSCWL